jgi:lipid II isoglutaminyl synthase (glutamine-hydrolysing)
MLWLGLAAARLVGAVSRLFGRGGTSLPGKLLLAVSPSALRRLGARLSGGSIVISATNGKTTTAAMTAAILESTGAHLVHNRAGANMAGGVASALAIAARPGRGMRGDTGLFEVDEFWLERVVADVQPRAVLLSNLFRDQLDRYGELEAIGERWADVVDGLPGTTTVVLNADDPLVADLGRNREGVVYFGVDDAGVALPGLAHASDSKHCRRCGTRYDYEAVLLGHLGHYHCPNCGARRPDPQVRAERVQLEGVRGARMTVAAGEESVDVHLGLPGLYNVYNALAAAALGVAWGVSLGVVAARLSEVAPAFGRAETLNVDGRELSILLVKNPAGANEVLRTLTLEPGEHDLLGILNDNIADGRDVSWVWDADFEALADRVRHVTCAGTRAAELGLRLKYAGIPAERISVEPDLRSALDGALQRSRHTLYALPTYTAMLALRDLLVARGHARSSWA